MKTKHLIGTGRQRLRNESRDLVHEFIRLTRVQDPSEATHLRIGAILELLKPVVHNPTLPCVVYGIGCSNRRVEQPLGSGSSA